MSESAKKLIKFWLPVVLWAGVIYWFSSRSVTPSTQIYFWDFLLKKTAHIVVYFTLSTLIYRALTNYGVDRKQAAFAAILVCFAYGISDEIHQSFTPGREPTLRDVLIDTFGASLSIILIWRYLPKAPKVLKNWADRLQIS